MDTEITLWLREMMVTFIISLIFNILPSLISKEKIDFVKVLKTTLVTSLISLVYKFIIEKFYEIFDPTGVRDENSLQGLILSPLLFSLISNVGQLILSKKKLSFKNIIVDTSNTVKNLSNINFVNEVLSEMSS